MSFKADDLFQPTEEQREQMKKLAAERGVDTTVRDDRNMYRMLARVPFNSPQKAVAQEPPPAKPSRRPARRAATQPAKTRRAKAKTA